MRMYQKYSNSFFIIGQNSGSVRNNPSIVDKKGRILITAGENAINDFMT